MTSSAVKEVPAYIRVIVLIFIALLGYFGIKRQNAQESKLKSNGRFSIGKTKGWTHSHRSSRFSLYYEFPYKGVTYNDFVKVKSLKNITVKEGKYLILFDPDNPKNSRPLLDQEIKYPRGYFVDTSRFC